MDLHKIIVELDKERRRLETAISALESLEKAPAGVDEAPSPHMHRGRRLMSPEERRIVSERMKKYWASRQASLG